MQLEEFPMINRRSLMGLLAGAILTPEGLWVPGQKSIILPARRRLMEQLVVENVMVTLPKSWGTDGLPKGPQRHLTIESAHPSGNHCPRLYFLQSMDQVNATDRTYMLPYYKTGSVTWRPEFNISKSVWRRDGNFLAGIFERPNGQQFLEI
jgi:hypothetical protein